MNFRAAFLTSLISKICDKIELDTPTNAQAMPKKNEALDWLLG